MSISPSLAAAKSSTPAAQNQKKMSSHQHQATAFSAIVSKMAAQASPTSPQVSVTPSKVVEKVEPTVLNSASAGVSSSSGQNNAYFYGNNGQAYSLAPPTGDSFLASNGQTYTKQQVKDFYAKNPNFGADLAQMAKLGLKTPDLYKARALAGQGNGTGIYTDPKEMAPYHDYLRSAMSQSGSPHGAMAFDQWRNVQTPSYLASLQTGSTDNVA
ncbi:MAG: hypothetical protein V4858_11905 [Pseudomonadota bacterium]